MIYISFIEDEDEILWKKYINFIKKKVKEIFKYYKVEKSIFIILTDSENMIDLNNKYRNVNNDTNVIAIEMKDDIFCLGEIILSFTKIEQEFNKKDNDYTNSYIIYNMYDNFKNYLLFIITHGILHLLGYDHQNDEQEKHMNEEQTLLLNNL